MWRPDCSPRRGPAFRRPWRLALAAGAAGVLMPLAAAGAQPPGAADAAAPVTDGPVYAIAHQPGGNTYIGGDFSHVGTRSGHGIALSGPATAASGTALVQGPPAGTADFPEVAGGEVDAVASDGHGGWFLGGDFTHVSGADVPRLAHVLPGGAVDASWRPAPAGGQAEVLALAVGEPTDVAGPVLYVGGDFDAIGGAERHFLAAFALDPATGGPAAAPIASWQPGQASAAGGGPVRALAVIEVTLTITDGSGTGPRSMPLVLAGGDFTKLGSNAANHSGIGPIWGVGAVKDDANADGVAEPTAGMTDSTWNPSPGLNSGAGAGPVNAIAVGGPADPPAPGGKENFAIYVGGEFAQTGVNRLAAYRLELTTDSGDIATAPQQYSNWNGDLGAGTGVRALELSPDGSELYVGGDFATIGEGLQARDSLAALAAIPPSFIATNTCSTAQCPATVDDGWKPEPDRPVNALAAAGGAVVAGGEFTRIGTGTPATRNSVAALAPAGDSSAGQALTWDPLLAGGPVNALAADADSVYAGGAFSAVGAVERDNLAAIDQAGDVVQGFDPGTACATAGYPCSSPAVRALALSSDGSRLFAGGGFTEAGGAARVHLAALDTTTGQPIPDWAPDPDSLGSSGGPDGKGWVLSLDVAGSALYAGGAFTRIGSPPVERRRVAALDATTGAPLDWTPNATCAPANPSCNVYAIEASCGIVYAGGAFEAIGGAPRALLASLEPVGATAPGQATSWNPSPGGVVFAIAPYASTVYAGGRFTVAGGAVRERIAALDAATGQAVAGWNPAADQDVRALETSGDGATVYAGGVFARIGGADRHGLAALDAAGGGAATSWDPRAAAPLAVSGAGFPGTAALAASGENVFAGGDFGELGTLTQSGYGSFTAGPDPAAGEPEVCANQQPAEQPAAPEPDAAPAPPPIPALSKLKVSRKLRLRYRLSAAATVEIDVDRLRRGVEQPAGGGAGGATICVPPSAQNRRERPTQPCRFPDEVKDLVDVGTPGRNKISLNQGKNLGRGRYRVTLLALGETGDHGPPAGVGFRVDRCGKKVAGGAPGARRDAGGDRKSCRKRDQASPTTGRTR